MALMLSTAYHMSHCVQMDQGVQDYDGSKNDSSENIEGKKRLEWCTYIEQAIARYSSLNFSAEG